MIFSARRKPYALLFCYGLVSAIGGVYASSVMAQAPLRVDPVLLGLPPLPPAQAPAPAAAPPPAPAPAPAPTAAPAAAVEEAPKVEVKPVEPAVVESRPVDATPPASAGSGTTAIVAPPAQPPSRQAARPASPPSPAPQAPAAATAPAPLAPSSPAPRAAPSSPPPAAAKAAALPAPAANAASAGASSLAPLRVDPVLLGLPPLTAAASPAPSSEPPSEQAAGPASPPTLAPQAPAASAAAAVPAPAAPSSPAPTAAAKAPALPAPAPVASAASGRVSSLPPLRVDPALLGSPPPTATASAAPTPQGAFGAATPPAQQRLPQGPGLAPATALASAADTSPPLVPPTGPRDEEEVPDALPALALRASRSMVQPAKDSSTPLPIFLRAQRMGGDIDREFVAEGEAELRKIGTVVNTDRLTYWPLDDEVEAEGHVRLEQGDDFITGPKMRLRIEDEIGYFDQPSYSFKRLPQPGSKAAADKAFAQSPAGQQGGKDWFNSGFATPRVLDIKPGQSVFKDKAKPAQAAVQGRGEAERIDFEGHNQMRLTKATYTTCSPGNDDWYTKVGELKLDYDREVADGTDGTVYFKDVPIFYSPWLSFSLNNERKSGFLAPTFGTNSVSGVELRQPYYWNIAPNMDATIAPRVMSKRGLQLENEFRYLNTAYGGLYRGEAHVEVVPSDALRDGDRRYAMSLQHLQTTAAGFTGQINYKKVSDDDYFTDLSSNIAQTSQINLTQQAILTYGGAGWWDATANFLSYQTLQPDLKNLNPVPYKTLPQLTFNARSYDLFNTDVLFSGQYTNFTIDKRNQVVNGKNQLYPDGQRTVLYPQISMPYVRPGWYITPKLGVNVRNYALSGQAAGTPASQNVALPIASVDGGMTFERASNWFGKDYTQTLEPRLYYLNIPYKNQDQIPIFDTALADFNFAQIFSENQYTGWDRINNANQLTAALTSRLLDPSSGNEIMRAMLGQRFYFTRNKVGLEPTADPTTDDRTWEKSDVLAAFSGQILPKVYADAAWEYNLADRHLKRYSMGVRFEPEPGKVLNAAYRYNKSETTPIDQVDVSGQWPITGRWHLVGRVNYSFRDEFSDSGTDTQGGRMIESIAGLEYNGGCWVVRGVVRRTALTQDNTSTAFFIQLELNDFSSIGSNPLNMLKRNIQGYSLINQPTADPVFGD